MRFVIVLLLLPLGEISAESAKDKTGDGLVVGLALSGGGLRSTGVSYGAMLELEERGLLKRIDFISAVSGGSIVGSYYCLGLPLKEFGPKLNKNLLTTSLGKALNPKKLFNDKEDTRVIGFAEALDQVFFGNKRITELCEQPFLLINTVNVENTSLFVFTRDGASDENLVENGKLPQYMVSPSQLHEIQVSHAVAASSAVPTLFSSHKIKAVNQAVSKKGKRDTKTIRLIDGGIFDNAGLEPLLVRKCDVIIAVDSSRSVLTKEGYTFFAPGGSKVIPITRRRYRSLLETYTKERLGDRFIHMTITDKKIDEMNLFKVKLKKKELDLLVKHGRELIEENLESIQIVLKQTEQNRPGSSKR
ncbi:MAG: patatin-like phospholipase family protein [Planctomycetota bacterium]|nr:patatin-like phospholipase family protein [Planctomycetota bacterium]